MSVIKCPEPECTNLVSDQASACPKCGCTVRKVEYKFVTVTHNFKYGGYSGQDEYESLMTDGWHVVEKREEDLVNDSGDCYKLQR
jgi:hypothetical protein